MNVAQFIDWLRTQPQDAKVQVLHIRQVNYDTAIAWKTFDPSTCANCVGGLPQGIVQGVPVSSPAYLEMGDY